MQVVAETLSLASRCNSGLERDQRWREVGGSWSGLSLDLLGWLGCWSRSGCPATYKFQIDNPDLRLRERRAYV